MSIVKGRKSWLTFDGVDDYIELPNLSGNFGSFEMTFTPTIDYPINPPTRGVIFANDISGTGEFIFSNTIDYSNENLQLKTDSPHEWWGFALNQGQKYNLRLEHDGTTYQLYYDNNLISKIESQNTSPFLLSTIKYIGRRYNNTLHLNAEISYIRIKDSNDNVVAEYDFQDGSGTTLTDVSGNGNDATIVGATWQSEANAIQNIYYGRTSYLTFDGVNDYVNAGTGLQITGEVEIEVEIEFTSFPSGTRTIIGSGFDGSTTGYTLRFFNQDLSLFTFDGTVREVLYDTSNLNLNQVYMFKGVIDSNNVYRLFIDGVEVASQSHNEGAQSTTAPFYIGANDFGGDIQRFAPFKLYSARVNDGTNDVAFWDLTEGNGTTINDSIGNNDGTIVGATWNDEGVPVPRIYLGSTLVYSLAPIPTYDLIADVEVTSNTTQIDFDNLNITKDDEVRLVYTFVGDSSSDNSDYELRYNDVSSGYTRQRLSGVGSNLTAARFSDSRFALARSNINASGFLDIKISNNDRFVVQSQFVLFVGNEASSVENLNRNIVNTNSVTSITKLSVVSDRTNGIATGSRLQLYKVNKGGA